MKTHVVFCIVLAAYPAWLTMMSIHEFGHVLHAWLSGGRLQRVSVPLLGFSYTELAVNPHPLFVAWGGFVWGCAIPLVAAMLTSLFGTPSILYRGLQLFAGFCLIANGAYLAVGQYDGVGDAGDLLRGGAPRWMLIAAGGLASAGGLLLSHRAGHQPRRSG